MKDSHLEYDKDGNLRAAVGPDAVSMYAAAVLASALRLYATAKIQANRAFTPKAMLQAATRLTGKKYKRGQYQLAADDVSTWVATMKAALPQETRE